MHHVDLQHVVRDSLVCAVLRVPSEANACHDPNEKSYSSRRMCLLPQQCDCILFHACRRSTKSPFHNIQGQLSASRYEQANGLVQVFGFDVELLPTNSPLPLNKLALQPVLLKFQATQV